MLKTTAILISCLFPVIPTSAAVLPGLEPGRANPVLPGYYADPSVVRHENQFFLYATLDPWGGDTLGCWQSPDFKQWTYRTLNWPTKPACTSPESGAAAVWAPSVVRGPDGLFHMFVSVGNEVWVGVAKHPLGPWKDANGGKPLVPKEYKPGFHMIDAEAFVDDDGTPWLYWGSGHGWTNGKCWAVKLNRAMNAFDGEPRDVTPGNYFEGPIMVKRHGLYFLMYSQGVTIKDTYQVHYAVGKHPLGPFVEGPTSPVLVTDKSLNVISPGHHTIFHHQGRDYILYHRHSIPFDEGFIGRQTCVDEIRFLPDGTIAKVTPTHCGPSWLQQDNRNHLAGVMTASSSAGEFHPATAACDANLATLWKPANPEQESWLQLDLGSKRVVSSQEIRFEYAWKPYHVLVQSSLDGNQWVTIADYSQTPATGSPVIITTQVESRFLRLWFPGGKETTHPGVFEWFATPSNP